MIVFYLEVSLNRTKSTYRCLQHFTKCHVCASQLEHVFLENEMLSPEILDIGFQSRSKGSVIVESSDATIDLEGLGVEELSLQEVLTVLTVVLLSVVNWLVLLGSSGLLFLNEIKSWLISKCEHLLVSFVLPFLIKSI